jgi:hypothetical protein
MPKKPTKAAPAAQKKPAVQAKAPAAAAKPAPVAAKPAAAPEAHRSGKPTNPFMVQKPPRLDGRRG